MFSLADFIKKKGRTLNVLAIFSLLTLSIFVFTVVPVGAQSLTINLDTDTGIYAQNEVATITFTYAPNVPILIEIRNSTQTLFAWEDTTNSSGVYILLLRIDQGYFPPGNYTLYARAQTAIAIKNFKVSEPFISIAPPRALKADLSNTTIPTPIYYYFNGSTIHIATDVYAPNDHFTLTLNATALGLGYLNYTSSQANSAIFPYGSGKLYRYIINLTIPNGYQGVGGQPVHISAATPSVTNYTQAFIAVTNINPRDDPTLGLSGSTTDFRTVTDFTNIVNLTFEKFLNGSPVGKLVFLQPINLCDMNTVNSLVNLGNNLNIALAKMSLNTAADALAAMNVSSLLYMYNLPFTQPPGILKDGVPVVLSGQTSGGPVYELSWDNTTKILEFKVTHWTTYEADGQPPSVTIISPQNTSYTTSYVPINVSATDPSGISRVIAEVNGITNYTLVLSNGYYVNSSTISLNQGSNTIRIYANDTLNNINSTQYIVCTVTPPAPPPAPPPTPPPAPTPLSGTSASITLSVVANVPTIVDVSAQAPSSSLRTVEILTNESFPSVQLTTSEYSDNPTSTPLPSAVTPISFIKIDVNVPSGAVTQATIKFRVPKSTLSLLALDPLSVQLYRLDTAWGALPTSLAGQDGDYYYYGAVSPGFSYFAIAGKPLVAESVPPTITSFSPEGTVTEKRPIITVKYSDNVAIDTTSVRLLLDNVDVTALATVNSTTLTYKPLTDLSEGNHSLYFEVKDTSGNKASKSWSFTVSIPVADTTPPVISTPVPPDGSLLRNATVTIGASYSDNMAIDLASVELKVDNVKVVPTKLTPSGVEYTATLSEGTHTASLTVKDTSGNVATATWSFTIRLPVDYTPYIVAVIVIIILAGVVLALRRKK
ncbi:MAG: PGF-pre-PGF domain-containing protein [Candidatus Methanomethylicaceae archaeon]